MDTSSHEVTVASHRSGVYGVPPEHIVLLRSSVVVPVAPWELVTQHGLLPRAAVEWGGEKLSTYFSSLLLSPHLNTFSLSPCFDCSSEG